MWVDECVGGCGLFVCVWVGGWVGGGEGGAAGGGGGVAVCGGCGQLGRMMALADTNGDGVVDFAEFKALMAAHVRRAPA